MKHRYRVWYRFGGVERTSTSRTEDRAQIAETLAKVWKCRPDQIEVVKVEWYSLRPAKVD